MYITCMLSCYATISGEDYIMSVAQWVNRGCFANIPVSNLNKNFRPHYPWKRLERINSIVADYASTVFGWICGIPYLAQLFDYFDVLSLLGD